MADDVQIPAKPSCLTSMVSGATGFIKGAFAGGSVGAIAGAVVAAAAALVGGTGVGLLAGPAAWGAIVGAVALGTVGSMAGTMTGVVRSREAAQVSGDDVVNVAKVAFSQGVSVGANISQMQEVEGAEQEGSKWRDKVTAERGAPTQGQQLT